eukprot:g41337.t1
MQVDKVVTKMFGLLAFVDQSAEYRTDVLLRLCKTLMRPCLEIVYNFWLSRYRKDVIKLETMQKKFIRMLPGLEGLSYKQRLDVLGLVSLDHRRLRSDLAEVYKIMRGTDRVNSQGLFPRVEESKTRDIGL